MDVTIRQARGEISGEIRRQREALEQDVMTRVCAVSDPTNVPDPRYRQGLKKAVSAAIDYGIAELEASPGEQTPVPPMLLAQAQLAARNQVDLAVVLRRCIAGSALVTDRLIASAERTDVPTSILRHLVAEQASLLDHVIDLVTYEHSREKTRRHQSGAQQQQRRVVQLLKGELVDASTVTYSFDQVHVGLVAAGAGAVKTVSDLAKHVDHQTLVVPRDEEMAWMWLGGAKPFSYSKLAETLERSTGASVRFAVGEPIHGLVGWRESHQQAKAALPVALSRGSLFVRYGDVALVASMLQDDVLLRALHSQYLYPLSRARDGGIALKQTLRTFFSTGRNISATAAALGVSRQTISNRLSTVARHIDRPLYDCFTEMEAALHVEPTLNRSSSQP